MNIPEDQNDQMRTDCGNEIYSNKRMLGDGE